MTAVDPVAPPRADFPPVMPLTIGSLALVLSGGIVMASSFPDTPSLILPAAVLSGSAPLWGLGRCLALLETFR
ncbi:MAG: hypothetical protein M3010_03225 [Candidatus Dormibacteraeota bacterium]|nr:hypothetical protein [Candidatus Dormibacteraeota bacterium]